MGTRVGGVTSHGATVPAAWVPFLSLARRWAAQSLQPSPSPGAAACCGVTSRLPGDRWCWALPRPLPGFPCFIPWGALRSSCVPFLRSVPSLVFRERGGGGEERDRNTDQSPLPHPAGVGGAAPQPRRPHQPGPSGFSPALPPLHRPCASFLAGPVPLGEGRALHLLRRRLLVGAGAPPLCHSTTRLLPGSECEIKCPPRGPPGCCLCRLCCAPGALQACCPGGLEPRGAPRRPSALGEPAPACVQAATRAFAGAALERKVDLRLPGRAPRSPWCRGQRPGGLGGRRAGWAGGDPRLC